MKIIIGLVFMIGLANFCLSLFSTKELNEFASDEIETVKIDSMSKKKIIEDFDDFNTASSTSSLVANENNLSSESASRDVASLNLSMEQEAELQNNIDLFEEINDKKDEIEHLALKDLEELERIDPEMLECSSETDCLNLLKKSFFDLGKTINGPEMSFLFELDFIRKKQRLLYEEKIKEIKFRFQRL